MDLINSKAFNKATNEAKNIFFSNKRYNRILRLAMAGLLLNKDRIKDFAADLQTFIRLMKCYQSGRYKNISAKAMIIVITAIIYFVNPFDLVPDLIPVLGFADDAAVLAYVAGIISTELEAFRLWENQL